MIDADSDVADKLSATSFYITRPTDQHFNRYPSSSVEGARRTWVSGQSDAPSSTTGVASQCINGKAETLEQRATFSEAFQSTRRCVVPADGFYEWTGPAMRADRYGFTSRVPGDPSFFAGLYESLVLNGICERHVRDRDVRAANAVIGEIHDRMPVILDERAAEDWMNPREEDPFH